MRQLILASTSPRRQELLSFLGVSFETVASQFAEEAVNPYDFKDPRDYVATLSTGKAFALMESHPDHLVLGADTAVFSQGKYYGKPANLDDALRILRELRGRQHEVYTGICLLDTLAHKHEVVVSRSLVTFRDVSDTELATYIDTSESLGKAGAYAIQGGAKKFASNVAGSLSNVVGLPLLETARLLGRFGVHIDVDVDAVIKKHFTFSD